MTGTNRLPGHELAIRDHGPLQAICSCGETSEHVLSSRDVRDAWLQVHKDLMRQEIRAKKVKPTTNFPYMSVVPDRAPEKKAHTSLGQARKAVLYRMVRDELSVPCRVYSWSHEGGWKILWDIPAGTNRKDLPWTRSTK